MPLLVLMLALSALLFQPVQAWSLDLHQAKAAGLVGEQADGYLGVVSADAQAVALVRDINGKRRAYYQQIAAKNGTSLTAVELLAGKTAQARTATGQYIMLSSGRWVRK